MNNIAYSVTFTNANGCTGTASKEVTINSIPAISSATSSCNVRSLIIYRMALTL
ncbi:MAG: hypothetical protein IPN94_05780 [Sphingobacteriales bacterium]|jgi:hypothetical protein|nr:hypothetical protein [Sphingobacteriales bacterium]